MSAGSTRVALVRHGQTEWNRVERFRGRAELELNDTGRRQAQAVARRLAAEFPLAAIYSSPLRRAWETAEAIGAAAGLKVQALPGIIDLDYGQWEGLTPEEAAERDPARYALWLSQPHLVHLPGGESLGQVRERAGAALHQVIEAHQGQTIALVSHRVVCKVLMCLVLGLDNAHFWRIEQDTGAINIFEWRGGLFIVQQFNDTCHLRGL